MSSVSNKAKDLGDTVEGIKTGRDLDALVAEKVMGWTGIEMSAYVPYGRDACGNDPSGEGGFYNSGRKVLPRYSTDIAAAFSVIEKMNTRRILVGIGNSEIGWQVAFFAQGLKPWRADAPKLPEATCRAALHAMECLSISDDQQRGKAS